MKTIKLDKDYSFKKTYFYNKTISVPSIVKCMFCIDGKHTRIGDGKIVECPVCKGKGSYEIGSGSIKEHTSECFLNEIRAVAKANRIDADYLFTDQNDDVIGRCTIYDTFEEAVSATKGHFMGYTS